MEALLHSLLEHWPGLLFRQRPDLTFDLAGARLEQWTGIGLARWQSEPELLWQSIHELDADVLKQQLRDAGESAEGVSTSFRVRHAATGRVTYLSEFRRARRDAAGQIQCYEGFWIDITRQTLAERRLAAAAWKETLGLLTLGLAHDFNNVLAGILGLSESFLSQIPEDHPFREGLLLVRENTRQAAQLIRRIAQLHRGKTGTRGYHDLNALVKDGVELIGKVVPKRLEVRADFDPGQLPVYLDAVEFQQVMINLALNAAEAMPERGTISVRTWQAQVLPSPGFFVGVPPRLPAVCLEMADTGHGIKPGQLPFIFDPFFTTKPMNRGSGLGLYNARLFVEKHQGLITVESAEGRGTRVQVWLPAADFTEADRAAELSGLRRRSVLLAGPEGRMRDATAEFLRQHNYHVVACGADAEDCLRTGDYQFDGVILLTLPADPLPGSIARLVRRHQLPLKLIVKTVGCNPDELDLKALGRVDLILSADTPEDEMLDRLAGVFDLGGRS